MIDYTEAGLLGLTIHYVGNRSTGGELELSNDLIDITETDLREQLKEFFIAPYKEEALQQFTHISELELNAMFNYCGRIFADSSAFYTECRNIASHLYQCMSYPGIKEGELLIGYFDNIVFNDRVVEGLAIIKSETKDTFFKAVRANENYSISADNGMRKDRLDKACLILNMNSENGYVIMVVDRTNTKDEARFWMDGFLNVKPIADNYNKTEQFLTLTKNFIKDKLPEEFEVSKTDQIDLLNKSMAFFKSNEEFEYKNFVREVMQEPGMIHSFGRYKDEMAQVNPLALLDEFTISDSAVKRQSRVFKSVLKLDKNFHVYIHGNREYIEKGYDEERGMNYYKIFYKEES